MTQPPPNQDQQKKAAILWVKSTEFQLRQQESFNDVDLVKSFTKMAEESHAAGKVYEAEALWVRLLEIARQSFGKEDLRVGLIAKGLINFYRSQGRYSETEPLLQELLQLWQQLFGEDHPSVATALNDLGALRHREGRLQEAEAFYLKAIPLLLKKAGENHPDTQNALNNFHHLLRQAVQENQQHELSSHPITQALLKKQLANVPKQPGEHHQVVMKPADLEQQQILTLRYGKEKGEAIFIVQLLEKTLHNQGLDLLSLAQELNNEAEIYRSEGKIAEAETCWLRSLEIYRQVANSANRLPNEAAIAMNNLASFYRSQNRYSEAEELFLIAISTLINTLGSNHPTTEIVWNNFTLMLVQVVQENRVDELSANPLTRSLLQAI